MEKIQQMPKPLLWGYYVLACLFLGYMIGKGLAL